MKNFRKISIYLLAITTFFFIISAFTFYFYVKKINNNYQELVKKELNNFHHLQQISMISYKNYFYILKVLQSKETSIDSSWYKWQYLTLLNNKNFERLSDSLGIFSKDDSLYKALLQSRSEYLKAANFFFENIKDPNDPISYGYFVKIVSPSFNNYETQLDKYTQNYKDMIINHSAKISSEVNSASLGFLLFGFSPLLLTLVISAGYVLFVGCFLIFVFISPPIPE